MATSPMEQTRQARSVARIITEQAKRANDAEMVQEAVPVILKALLRSLMHTVRICDRCWGDHFQPKPINPSRDCLNVRCECWCTNRERAMILVCECGLELEPYGRNMVLLHIDSGTVGCPRFNYRRQARIACTTRRDQ